LAIAAVVVAMLPFNVSQTAVWLREGLWADWAHLHYAGLDAGSPNLYGYQYDYRWSPLLAYALTYLPAVELWVALHVCAALLLRPWWLVPIVLASYPFGEDARVGNVIIFVVVAALYAVRGNRLATGIFFAFALLMPRPLMLPVTAWLLWKRPEWRWPFAGMFVLHAGLVAMTGLGDEWLRRLVESSEQIGHFMNFGPSRWLGVAWLPIGLALGAWLTWKGRLGLASLAIQPYMLPYYLLFGVLEAAPSRSQVQESSPSPEPLATSAPRRPAPTWPRLWPPRRNP
jgi:hypothetical protein